MKRIFWLGVGATIGVLVVRKATKTVESFTPAGIASSFGGLGDVVRDFVDDVRTAMDEHERELLDALGVDSDPGGGGGRHTGASAPGAEPTGGSARPRRH